MSGFNSPCAQWLVILFGFLVIPDRSDFFHKVEIKKAAGRDDSFSQLGGLLLRVKIVGGENDLE